MMKKLIGILLVLMLAFSLPVYAEATNAGNDGTVTSAGNDGTATADAPRPMLISANDGQRVEAYKEMRQEVIAAREKYQAAVQAYAEKKTQYQDAKAKYLAATPEEQAALKVQLRNRARETLGEQAGALIQKMKELEEQGIAPENSAEIIADLEAIQLTLEDTNASKEEIVQALKDIRDTIIPEIKYRAQVRAANALDNKIAAILNKANVAESRVQALVDNLAEKGIDTTQLDEALIDFSANMDEVTVKYAEAKAKWQEAETAEDKHAVLKEGFDIAKELNRMIVEAHKELKQALIEIKESATVAAGSSDDDTTVSDDSTDDSTDDLNTEGDDSSDASETEDDSDSDTNASE